MCPLWCISFIQSISYPIWWSLFGALVFVWVLYRRLDVRNDGAFPMIIVPRSIIPTTSLLIFMTFVSGPLSPWLPYHPIDFSLIDCRIAWQLSAIGRALGSDIIGRCSWALLPTLSTRDTFNPLSSRLNYRCVVSFFQDNCSLPLPEEWILDIAVRSE